MRLELGLRLLVVTVVACCRAGTVLMAIVHTVSAQNLSDLSASPSELEVGLLSFMPEPEPIIRHVKKRMKREKPFANRKMNKQLSMKSPRIQMKIWCSCKAENVNVTWSSPGIANFQALSRTAWSIQKFILIESMLKENSRVTGSMPIDSQSDRQEAIGEHQLLAISLKLWMPQTKTGFCLQHFAANVPVEICQVCMSCCKLGRYHNDHNETTPRCFGLGASCMKQRLGLLYAVYSRIQPHVSCTTCLQFSLFLGSLVSVL